MRKSDSDHLAGRRQRADRHHPLAVVGWSATAVGLGLIGLLLPAGGDLGTRAGRAAALLLVLLFAFLFRPGSRLHTIPADPAKRQGRWQVIIPRLVSALVILGFLARFAGSLGSLVSFQPAVFDDPVYHYVYDFDQYNDLGRALLHGHAWLSLPVPPELASAADPYSPDEIHRILGQGARPIYWDHAFYQGHWYSYFGVLPAFLIFLPFQAVAHWLGADGAILSTSPVTLLLGVFAAWGTILLVSRLIRVYFPGASLGLVGLSTIGALCATNLPYCLFRANFYCLPIVAALILVSFGLWVWLGAARPQRAARTGDKTGGPPPTPDRQGLSRWRVGLGSFLIALSLGCRPTFIIALLLAFPIFWPQIRSGTFFSWLQPRWWKRGQGLSSLPADGAALLPALLAFAPFLAYNHWRFGSLLDFGSAYQITISDMTSFHVPWPQLPLVIWNYLGQPLRFIGDFPFLTVTDSSVPGLPDLEPQIGGYFAIYPFAWFALIGVVAILARRLSHRGPRRTGVITAETGQALFWASVGLGGLMVVFVAYSAGLNWRYMSDFAPLFSLAAILALCRLSTWTRDRPSARAALIIGAQALVGLTVVITFASLFIQGRADAMSPAYPFFDFVRAWFTH